MTETIAAIVARHRAQTTTPAKTVARTFQRIRDHGDPAIFISLRDESEAIAEAKALLAKDASQLPLFGVPFAVKDNIDVAGLPTTAACPAFSYNPSQDANTVARLRAAGAIVIGKTNLDQFATGLVGVRSPYGIPKNPVNSALVPGGSSSGSAVAVSAGLVPFSLGTDTAGSGRVPAMLNNIVGLKPSLGLMSTFGVVPACRTLDCVSIFALSVDDAMIALAAMAGYDSADPYSRERMLSAVTGLPAGLKLGIPRSDQLKFFGDTLSEQSYFSAVDRLAALGATKVEFDLEPFYETAKLLYHGPWVAERYLVIRDLLASNPDAVHSVTRDITLPGAKVTGAETFASLYKLEALRRVANQTLATFDAMVLPTAPSAYTVAQVLADPVELNTRNGTYTNFVNLLDMCGLAVPAAMRPDGIPFGITLLGPAGQDALLASIGRVFHADTKLPVGSKNLQQQPLAPLTVELGADEIPIVAVGAHMSGMALNHELLSLKGRLLKAAATAPDYRLYALKGTVPPKPGLLRVEANAGAQIQIEVWTLSTIAFGKFVAAIPSPLSIGTIKLADGSSVKGFLAEAEAIKDARDITSFGGWREFMATPEPR